MTNDPILFRIRVALVVQFLFLGPLFIFASISVFTGYEYIAPFVTTYTKHPVLFLILLVTALATGFFIQVTKFMGWNLTRIHRNRSRHKMRRRLWHTYFFGASVAANLPTFLDRAPRHDLHRALQSAYNRGFRAEQRMPRQTKKKYDDFVAGNLPSSRPDKEDLEPARKFALLARATEME